MWFSEMAAGLEVRKPWVLAEAFVPSRVELSLLHCSPFMFLNYYVSDSASNKALEKCVDNG